MLLSWIRFALVILWTSVAIHELANTAKLHGTLCSQPLPGGLVDILFWLTPLLDFAAAALIAWTLQIKTVRKGLWLSALLTLGSTFFILMGMLNWFDPPHGCGLVISELSGEQHLWINLVFLLLSVLGLWLVLYKKTENCPPALSFRCQMGLHNFHVPYSSKGNRPFKKMFPLKFALFRRRAVEINIIDVFVPELGTSTFYAFLSLTCSVIH